MSRQEQQAIRIAATRLVAPEDVDRARQEVGRVLAHVPEPARSIQVTLGVLADPAVRNPALASARIDLDGGPVNARAAAPTMPQAVAVLGDRLRIRLDPKPLVRQSTSVAEEGTL
ncbi:hypothetical protein [Thermomonospora umbrina]|uniref:Uncharacterized protein n=1 Tax=Thermomonospora umbrina TaxID=111806 RepID=A0A3D9SN95_9ACTN|nr:hypothetical protein [Thermomonospora umbrina]REE97416.1 hypothetical protein DFJ69_2887 [Thermomonospora umbrina]